MPIDSTRVAIAISRGLSVVCATCEKYHKARDAGIPDDKCLAVDGCGSPIAGDTFHEYAGPMTNFGQFCFVCGNRPTHALRVNGHVRVIGCCTEHLELVRTLQPEGRQAVITTIISDAGEQTPDMLPAPSPIIRIRSNR